MRINESMSYIVIRNLSGFTRMTFYNFCMMKYITQRLFTLESGQDYTIVVDNFFSITKLIC